MCTWGIAPKMTVMPRHHSPAVLGFLLALLAVVASGAAQAHAFAIVLQTVRLHCAAARTARSASSEARPSGVYRPMPIARAVRRRCTMRLIDPGCLELCCV